MSLSVISHYFPGLTGTQREQFEALDTLYREWNAKINVISRKDIDHLHERHVLHALGIAKIVSLKAGADVLDVGTGGGFPGIPLAILFPETSFLLTDSIGKKIRVVQEISSALGLENVVAVQARAEDLRQTHDFVVSRAVMSMDRLIHLSRKKIKKASHHPLKNGILALKGGDLTGELSAVKESCTSYSLHDHFTEEFFVTKYVVHVSL